MSVDVNYYSFSPSRADREWKNFEDDFLAISKKVMGNDKEIVLSARQKDIYDNCEAGTIFYTRDFDENDLLHDLKAVDLYYGSVQKDYLESPKLESYYLETLTGYYKAEVEGQVPTKKELIRMFENMNADDLRALIDEIRVGLQWEEDEAKDYFVQYLMAIKPVVTDLKENDDAVFVRWYGGEAEVEPVSSETILSDRVKKHIDMFRQIKWIQ